LSASNTQNATQDGNSNSQTSHPKSHIPNLTSQISAWVLTIGLLLTGIGAAFAPWIYKESVALQLTAPGLAEFVKFLPEVRAVQIQIERLYFLAPLFLAMLALPFFAVNKGLRLPGWWRALLRLAVVPLSLASLSPVWTPAILMSAEFRLQTLLAAAAMGLSVISPLFKALPLKLLVIVLCLGGVVAIALPAWQFGLIQSSMENVYRESVSLGWGWWLTVGGVVLSLAGSIGTAFIWPGSISEAGEG